MRTISFSFELGNRTLTLAGRVYPAPGVEPPTWQLHDYVLVDEGGTRVTAAGAEGDLVAQAAVQWATENLDITAPDDAPPAPASPGGTPPESGAT